MLPSVNSKNNHWCISPMFFITSNKSSGWTLSIGVIGFSSNPHRQIFGYQAFHVYLSFIQIIGVISLLVSLLVSKEPQYRKTMLFVIALLFISYSLVYFYPRYIYLKFPLYFISFGALISWFQSRWKSTTATIISYIYLLTIFTVGLIPLAFFSYVVFYLNG